MFKPFNSSYPGEDAAFIFTQRNNYLIKAEMLDPTTLKGDIQVVDD